MGFREQAVELVTFGHLLNNFLQPFYIHQLTHPDNYLDSR